MIMLTMRWIYASAICNDHGATLDDFRKVVTILEDIEPITRRVLGGAHPTVVSIADSLQRVRVALRARETPQEGA